MSLIINVQNINPTEFINIFNQFINDLKNVLPKKYKPELIKIACLIRIKNQSETLKYFFEKCSIFHDDILNKEDKYIKNIMKEYPFLAVYYTLDRNSKKCTLDYLQTLYKISFIEVKKNTKKIK